MSTETLPVIQSLWVGTQLSLLEQLAASSFLYNGHAFHLYVYEEVSNVPAGVEIKDANKILDKSLIFKYIDRETYSGFANLFRYKLLYDKGGYWVDMDMVCLRPFSLMSEYVFSTEGQRRVGNCVIRAPKGSTLMRYCYETILDRGNLKLTQWGETGPIFFRDVVKNFNLSHYAVDPEVFCFIPYEKVGDIVRKSSKELLSPMSNKIRGVHFWNEGWRLRNMNKNTDYPDDCFYEELKVILL